MVLFLDSVYWHLGMLKSRRDAPYASKVLKIFAIWCSPAAELGKFCVLWVCTTFIDQALAMDKSGSIVLEEIPRNPIRESPVLGQLGLQEMVAVGVWLIRWQRREVCAHTGAHWALLLMICFAVVTFETSLPPVFTCMYVRAQNVWICNGSHATTLMTHNISMKKTDESISSSCTNQF